MGIDVPNFGIEINFIDNRRTPNPSPVEELSDGFMTDSIPTMVNLLRETADKLEKLA
ncbi:MAG: hypothetical protein ACAH80_08640 [Alphaproteobacteria bacterium]